MAAQQSRIRNEQEVWFDSVQRLVQEAHKHAHDAPLPQGANYDRQTDLTALFGAVCDVLDFITHSSSWESRQLQSFDKEAVQEQIARVLLWRLKMEYPESSPVEQQEIDRLRFLHDLDHKLADRFRAERDRLQEELADCTRDCRKAGERFEQALDLLCDVAAFFEDNQRGVTAEEMQAKIRAYLDSE